MDLDHEVDVEEVLRPVGHLQILDIAAILADCLGKLGKRPDLIVDHRLDAGGIALGLVGGVPGEIDPAVRLVLEG